MFGVYMVTKLSGNTFYRFIGEYESQDMAEKVASACARCNSNKTLRVVGYLGEVVENFTCNGAGTVTMY